MSSGIEMFFAPCTGAVGVVPHCWRSCPRCSGKASVMPSSTEFWGARSGETADRAREAFEKAGVAPTIASDAW